MIVVELFEELLDCRDVRLGQGMTFLGQVFTEELDVVALLSSVLGISAQHVKLSYVGRPLLPCMGEHFLNRPVEPLAMLVDQ